MVILKKLDNSSKFLILMSLIGIATSIVGFYYYSLQGSSLVDGVESIGKVAQYKNDVRIRRSGDIHWYPINQVSQAYEEDLLFTGENSSAVVEFLGGNKITLHSNSLISLSKNRVALENGTIEIDLSSKDALELDSFGETFKLKDKANVRVTQNDNEQNIVALNANAKSLSADSGLKKYINNDGIHILSPSPDKIFPRINEFGIQLSWKSDLPEKDFELEFWTSDSKTPFLKLKTTNLTENVLLKGFPDGLIFWKVSSINGQVNDRSSFYVSKETNIRPLTPLNKQSFSFVEGKESSIHFEWLAPLEYEQQIQIAKDDNFSNMIFQGPVSNMNKTIGIKKEGLYFWRVGYFFSRSIIRWSTSSEFQLKSEIMYSPIDIKVSAEFLDFSVNPTYEAIITDPNSCEDYEYILGRGNNILNKISSKSKRYQISKMEDGIYSLRVICRIGNIPRTESKATFVVKSSPPLKSPKIMKRKKPLFVKDSNIILNKFI